MTGDIHHAILKAEPRTLPAELWCGVPSTIQDLYCKLGPNHIYTVSVGKWVNFCENGVPPFGVKADGFIFID